METKKRRKIEDAIISCIAYLTKGFLGIMAIAFALMFIICLVQIFKEPIVSMIGGIGFGGGALILWDTQKNISTK